MPRGKPASGRRSDAGTQRSGWVDLACTRSGCENRIRRRASEVRQHVYCSQECYRGQPVAGPGRRVTTAIGTRYVDQDGYVRVYLGRGAPGTYGNSGYALEHRAIMAEHLGRPLLRSERPHHINGDRSDNRLANLELWSTAQPSGQRVEDKVRFARAILGLYGDHDERHRYGADRALLT